MEEFPSITRREIDSGTLRREPVDLVNSVRSSLFASRGVRRDVNVILYPMEPKLRMIIVSGEKLRFMGPDERSISILLSISGQRLMSEGTGREFSSPGVTVVNKSEPFVRIGDKSLVLKQGSDGTDLRRVKFTENTLYVSALNGEWRFGDAGSLLKESALATFAVRGPSQTDRTILMINNEIDRQLSGKRTVE
jgi:tRNA pseudouridine-54 N-methylase